jgi:hypothetical protein
MSWGLEWLELEPDADERAIKREYAKRLRSTRPDEDPVGFQQLHEAYQAALAWAQYREQCSLDDGTADAAAPASVRFDTPAADTRERNAFEPGPAGPALDPSGFVRQLLDTAATAGPEGFERWLQLRPELWSLRDKPLLGNAVLDALFHHDVPVPAWNFDLLTACFEWDDVESELDPYAAHQCRLRLHSLWVIQPGNEAALARFLHQPEAPVGVRDAAARLNRLTRPWDRLQSLWDAVWPKRAIAIRDMLAKLGVQDAADVPPPLQPAQVAFWLALTQRDLNGPQLQLACVRSALWALLALAGVLFLGFIQDIYALTGPQVSTATTIDLTMAAPFVALAVFAGGSLLLPICAVLLWQVSAEYPQRRFRLLRLLLIPALAITALLVIHVAGERMAGSFLAWGVLALAMVRLFVRGEFDLGSNLWVLLPCLPAVRYGPALVQYGEIGVFGALLVWTFDAVSQLPHKPRPRRR